MKIYSSLNNYSKPYYVSSLVKLKILHEKIIAKYKAKINGNNNAQFKDFTKERQQAAVLTRFFSDVKAAAQNRQNEVSKRDNLSFMDEGYQELVRQAIPSNISNLLGITGKEQGSRAESDIAAIVNTALNTVGLENMVLNVGNAKAGAENLININLSDQNGIADELTKTMGDLLYKEFSKYKTPKSYQEWFSAQFKQGKIDVAVKEYNITLTGTSGYNKVIEALNGATFTIKSYASLSWWSYIKDENGKLKRDQQLKIPQKRDSRLELGNTVLARVLYIMFSYKNGLNFNAPTAFSATYASLNNYKNNAEAQQYIEEISLIYELTGTGLAYLDPQLRKDINDLEGAKFIIYNDPSKSWQNFEAGGVYVESCGWILQQLLNSNANYKFGHNYELSRSLVAVDDSTIQDLFT